MDLQVHPIGIVVDDIDRAEEMCERTFGLSLKGRDQVEEFQAEGG